MLSKRTLSSLLTCLVLVLSGCQEETKRIDFTGLRVINGTELFINSFGSGSPLLVIHGGPGLGHNYFLPHLNELAKYHQLIFYDQRAAGRSSVEQVPDSMNLTTFARDIEAIRQSFGFQKINILSHSWGALLATEYASQYPHHVAALIYASPVPMSRAYGQEAQGLAAARMDEAFKAKRMAIMRSDAFQDKSVKAIEAMFLHGFSLTFSDTLALSRLELNLNNNFLKGNQMLQHFTGLESYDYYTSIKALDMPVLVIRGDNDIYLEKADDQMVSSFAKASLVNMPVGHFPFVEDSEAFIETIHKFLKDAR